MSRKQGVAVSFEFFPPGDAAMEKTLWESIRYLEPLSPRFVSVTYGADGSTRERTHNVVSRVQKETQLTCVPRPSAEGARRVRMVPLTVPPPRSLPEASSFTLRLTASFSR